LKWLLLPFAAIYGLITYIRNILYDSGFFVSYRSEAQIISVGNLTTGGTGKTPIAEYLISFLSHNHYSVGYLSRGYGRKTQGFLWVTPDDKDPDIFGDEALQVASKFPEVVVAICEDRKTGIQRMLTQHELQYIILDDAFQHRRVYRQLDLVVMDATRLPHRDWLLPLGRLREPLKGLKRADLFVVNKLTQPELMDSTKKALAKWGKPIVFAVPRFSNFCSFWEPKTLTSIEGINMILFSGLGNNAFFLQQVEKAGAQVKQNFFFRDHWKYHEQDLKKITQRFTRDTSAQSGIILTTEKDYHRLRSSSWLDTYREYPFYYATIDLHWWANEQTLQRHVLALINKD